jgi:hypothetical protein
MFKNNQIVWLYFNTILKNDQIHYTEDFNFAQLHYQLKRLVESQLLFNYQLHYQSLETKTNKMSIPEYAV